MEKKNTFTKILAIAGTVLVWLPILFMVVTCIVGSIQRSKFLCDYLLPAELMGVVFIGAALLIWAAIRARTRLKLIGWSLGVGLALLGSGLLTTQLTGLASGRIENEGLPFLAVAAMLIGYDLAVIALGISGILLIKALYRNP
ncbi:MAG TPA: hypothetical protein PKG95_05730 [Anaerolineaceae bacterium]|jgi:hypothetical protein|nr:hypothetical protein [Anaerolineaceae bacterium]